MITHNPLLLLRNYGQSVWLDYIERHIIEDGTIARLIAEDGLAGITSNPAIFLKSITQTDSYQAAITEMNLRGAHAEDIYEVLAIYDVRKAADLFRELYDHTRGADGYVSLEVSPLIAHDTEQTVAEARRLWKLLERPNVMIKIPATREGLPAIEQLISEGININVTLLFSVGRYVQVIEAYMNGLERRLRIREPLDHIASVASFFLSRIDTMVDSLLDRIFTGSDVAQSRLAYQLRGQAAIASAGFAYRRFTEHYATPRWELLAAHGARKQRLLWASTSTKDERYSDVKYVEPLIGPDTVNTLPMKTLEAYRRLGDPAERLPGTAEQAPEIMKHLAEAGVDMADIARRLEDEGVEKFVQPYRQLLTALGSPSRHAYGR